jgi:hypothetical protein
MGLDGDHEGVVTAAEASAEARRQQGPPPLTLLALGKRSGRRDTWTLTGPSGWRA